MTRKRRRRRRAGLAALSAVLAVTLVMVSASILPGLLFPHHDRYTILRVDYNAAGADLVYLCGSGPRLTGTMAEKRGAEYIAQQFESAGLTNVELLEYNVTCTEVEKASLSLVPYVRPPAPNPVLNPLVPNPREPTEVFEHETDFTVQYYSGSRGWSRWMDDLDVVDVGNGSDMGLYAGVSGKAVIVTNDGSVGGTNLFLQAWQAGAAANIIHNMVMDAAIGYPPVSFSADATDSAGHSIPLPDNYSGNGPDIPSLMVSKSVGTLIKEKLDSAKLRMEIQVTNEKRPVRVVVGDRKGSVQPNQIVMVGAHHDTGYNTPGAVDNTAGTVSVIAMARAIGKLRPAKTVRFATFGGEEQGLLGSYEYFKANSDKLKGHLVAMLNCDMSQIDTKREHVLPIVVNYNPWVKTLQDVKKVAFEKLPELSSYDVAIYNGSLNSSSDMATFALEGYRVGACWGSGCWEYHTPKDNVMHIRSESFLVVGAVYGSFALYLAGGKT